MLPQARLHQVRENHGKKQKWKCLDIILTNKMVCLCHAIPGKCILDIYFAIICLSFTNLESHSFDLYFLKKQTDVQTNSTKERRVCARRALWDVPWAQLSHEGVSPHHTGPAEGSKPPILCPAGESRGECNGCGQSWFRSSLASDWLVGSSSWSWASSLRRSGNALRPLPRMK